MCQEPYVTSPTGPVTLMTFQTRPQVGFYEHSYGQWVVPMSGQRMPKWAQHTLYMLFCAAVDNRLKNVIFWSKVVITQRDSYPRESSDVAQWGAVKSAVSKQIFGRIEDAFFGVWRSLLIGFDSCAWIYRHIYVYLLKNTAAVSFSFKCATRICYYARQYT